LLICSYMRQLRLAKYVCPTAVSVNRRHSRVSVARKTQSHCLRGSCCPGGGGGGTCLARAASTALCPCQSLLGLARRRRRHQHRYIGLAAAEYQSSPGVRRPLNGATRNALHHQRHSGMQSCQNPTRTALLRPDWRPDICSSYITAP